MGRASLGWGAGRPETALLWMGGWAVHPGDRLWYLWYCSPFSVFPPSLQAILSTVSASGSPMGAPCDQVSRPLGRGPDRGLRERGAGEQALDHQIAALPPEPHQGAAGHGGLGEGDTADRPPGIPAELGDRLVTRSSVQLESEPPVLGHTSLSHLWQVMPPGYLVPPSPSSASAPGSPPSSAPG